MADEPGAAVDVSRIRELLDEFRATEAIAMLSIDDVARAWSRYYWRDRSSGGDDLDHPDWWAYELWNTAEWWEDEERVRAGILRLIDLASTDRELESIGIENMEGDFFSADPSRLDWVDAEAARSDRFRRTLADLWLWSAGEGVLDRVERAARVRLPRPVRHT